MGYSVSCTTRPARPNEVDGKDYFFLTTVEFVHRREAGDFAEWAHVHDRMYGTLRGEVDRLLAGGRHVLMDIDVQGAAQFAAAFPDSVLIFLVPPSAEVLRQRLLGRSTEDSETLRRRLQTSRDELRAVSAYEYVVVNDRLDEAVRNVSAIIDAETLRRVRQPDMPARVESLVIELDRILAEA